MRKRTVGQLWPLQSGSTNQPTLTQGQQTAFQFQDVPDRSPTGPLAYYLPGVFVTFSGNVVQNGGGGATVFSDQFFGALFSSLAWIQAWHGSPLQAQHIQGNQWAVVEYFIGGHRYACPVHEIVAPSADGTYPFEITIFVPFSSCRQGDLEDNTSQLALLARASQLQINVAPAAALTALSTGSSFTNLKARASAILVPRQELVLGTPVETILTQIVAGSGNAVKITNFGTDTGLQGVDPGGGLLNLLFLTSSNGQGGSFASEDILDFMWQWRGQTFTQDVLALLQQWKGLLPVPPQAGITTGSGGSPALMGIPYQVGSSAALNPESVANVEQLGLLFWGLVVAGNDIGLTSLQTADSDQTFNMTVDGGYSGTHQIIGQYARSWQRRMLDNWQAQVFAGGGGSLAAHVLGHNYGGAKLVRRAPAGKHVITSDETRYLPWQLVP